MITFDKLIDNFDKFDKKGHKMIKQEVFKLFEPIIYQIVLATRMDTGTGRASVGYEFTRNIIKSQRILDAIDYDVEVNHPAYFQWSHRAWRDPYIDYKGIAKPLLSKGKIVADITIMDEGVLAQENKGVKPSEAHEREEPERHYPHHITEILKYVDSQDLEHFQDGSYFLPMIANDIRNRINDIYKKVEELLFT